MNAPSPCRVPHFRRQAGMTLIELMVAVVMALFMAAALLFIYAGMRNSYLAQDRLAQLQDSQRTALTMLATTLAQSGYYANPTTDKSSTALPAVSIGNSGNFLAGQGIVGMGDGSGTGAQSDTITARFQAAANDGILNCNGGTNTSAGPMVYTNTFAVNASNELTCAVNGGPAIALASNIGRMQILYGTDTQKKGAIDAYLPASIVTAQSLWAQVSNVKISLYFMDTSQKPATLLPNPVLQFISLQNYQ